MRDRDGWGEPSGEPRPDYRDAVEPDVPIEHEGKPARGQRVERPADGGYPDVPDLLGALRQSIERARADADYCTGCVCICGECVNPLVKYEGAPDDED